MNAKILLATAAAVAAISGAAQATTVDLGTLSTPSTVTGSVAYTSNELVVFKFTVDSPYNFSFTDNGSGGTFPFPIGASAFGGPGSYTETYGKFPVSGTLDYSLTAVPEPATWGLMIVGFGLAGASFRRRARVQAAA